MTAKDFFAKPQVQALLWRAVGASGFLAPTISKVCAHWGLPTPDPSIEVFVITTVCTEGAEWIVAWYRTTPNNIVRRAVKLINGATITDETKAEVIMAANSMPSVATVVISDSANGVIGALARNADHPTIVTETQNTATQKGT